MTPTAAKPSLALRGYVIEALTALGCTAWPQQQTSFGRRTRVGRSGVPDVIGFTPRGQFLAWEIKAGTDTLSSDQWIFLERLSRAGGLAAVVRCDAGLLRLLERVKCAHWHPSDLALIWAEQRTCEWALMRLAARKECTGQGRGLEVGHGSRSW